MHPGTPHHTTRFNPRLERRDSGSDASRSGNDAKDGPLQLDPDNIYQWQYYHGNSAEALLFVTPKTLATGDSPQAAALWIKCRFAPPSTESGKPVLHIVDFSLPDEHLSKDHGHHWLSRGLKAIAHLLQNPEKTRTVQVASRQSLFAQYAQVYGAHGPHEHSFPGSQLPSIQVRFIDLEGGKAMIIQKAPPSGHTERLPWQKE